MTQKGVDFDDFADHYEKILSDQLSFFSAERKYFSAYKIELVAKLLSEPPRSILDYGCGVGLSLPHFRRVFPEAEIHATDISQRSLEFVRSNYPYVKVLQESDINAYSYDLVFLATVLHHVPPVQRASLVKKLKILLETKGVLCVFEHNPYNPVTRKMVATCPFDEGVELISMHKLSRLLKNKCEMLCVKKGYCLFFPKPLQGLRSFEQFLSWLPIGGQYYMIARA